MHAKDLSKYLDTYVTIDMIDLGNDIFTLILQNNLNDDLLKDLKSYVSTDQFVSDHKIVKNNVALASAITAYARIHMMPYKLDSSCVYSDTDSVFTKDSLNLIQEGKELGLFKDELEGINIKEGY